MNTLRMAATQYRNTVRKPTAKSLILDLLLAFDGQPLSAKQAIAACSIFDISVNNTRVALVRLSAEGLIESAGRAVYQLTEDAHTLADDVASWRTKQQRLRSWDGDFICIQSGKLSRNESKARKARDRALMMLGFRSLNGSLYVRPNNIEKSIDEVRKRAFRLGLEKGAIIFRAGEFDPATQKEIENLWNAEELKKTYSNQIRKIETWLERKDLLETEVAAREAFLIGGAAIKHVVYDPFLPADWIDTDTRDHFIELVHKVDQVGQSVWRDLWDQHQMNMPGPQLKAVNA